MKNSIWKNAFYNENYKKSVTIENISVSIEYVFLAISFSSLFKISS